MKFQATIALLFAAAAAAKKMDPSDSSDDFYSFIDAASATGNYETLLDAVVGTAGVLDAIVANTPVTVFGPQDSAFDAISDVVAGLSEEDLANILAYHVTSGVYTSQDVREAGCVELTALNGEMLKVSYSEGSGVMVNDSVVVEADLEGEDGILHGIDTVILPGTFTPCPPPASSSKGSKKSSKGKGSSKGAGKGTSSKGAGKGAGSKGAISTMPPTMAPTTDAPSVSPTVTGKTKKGKTKTVRRVQ